MLCLNMTGVGEQGMHFFCLHYKHFNVFYVFPVKIQLEITLYYSSRMQNKGVGLCYPFSIGFTVGKYRERTVIAAGHMSSRDP